MKTICNSNFSVHNKVLLEHEKKKKLKFPMHHGPIHYS